MLVLSRKQDESLVIGDNIVITILSVERDQVRLGIEAPRDIPIVRFELFEAVREQNIIAAQLRSSSGKGIMGLREFLMKQASPDDEE